MSRTRKTTLADSVIFGFFVENHLLTNKKSSFHDLWFESYDHCSFFVEKDKIQFSQFMVLSSMSDSQL